MDYIRPTPRNPIVGTLADALRNTNEFLNKPGKILGIGLGDLVTGSSPTMVDNLSYGQGPFSHGAGMTTKMDPGLLDAALIPGVAGVVNALRKGGASLVNKAVSAPVDAGRRQVLNTLGAGATAAGLTASGVPLMSKILRAAEPAVLSKIAPAAVSTAAGLFSPAKISIAGALQRTANMLGQTAAGHPVDFIAAHGKLAKSEDAFAKGISNLESLYLEGIPESLFGNAQETAKSAAQWLKLEKQGIKDTDALSKAVFEGRIQATDLEPTIFANEARYKSGPYQNALEDMQGGFEHDWDSIFSKADLEAYRNKMVELDAYAAKTGDPGGHLKGFETELQRMFPEGLKYD